MVAIARFYTHDVYGALFMALTVFLGYLAVRNGMQVLWIMSFGIVCFVNSIFDSIILFLKASRTPVAFFSKSLPWQLNVLHGFLVGGCVLQAVAALICKTIHKDHVSYYEEEDQRLVEPYQANGSAQTRYGVGIAQPSIMAQQQSYQPFQGQGRYLSSK